MVDINDVTFADISELAEKIKGITVYSHVVNGGAACDILSNGMIRYGVSESRAYKILLELLEKQVKDI